MGNRAASQGDIPEGTRRLLRPGRRYIESFLRIRDKRGRVIPFRLNPAQIYIAEKKLESVMAGKPMRFLIPKARRMGVTTAEQAYSYSLAATRTNQRCVTIADSQEKTKSIFEMAVRFWESSPEAVRPYRAAKDRTSTTRLSFPEHDSVFFVGTAGSVSYGRGDTLSRVHGSEVAFWLRGRDQALVETLITGLTEAASHGEVCLESTANGNVGWWYESCMAADAGDSEWTLIFCPWFIDPTYRIPVTDEDREWLYSTQTDREAWLINEHGLDWEQIHWRRRKSNERAMRRLFLQEYPETLSESFLTSSTCFFDYAKIGEIERAVQPGESAGDNVTTWAHPVPGRSYVVGADCAEGLPEGDWSVAYVIDYESCEVVARLRGKIPPAQFAAQLGKISRHYNNALLGVERENHGHAVLQELMNHVGYGNLYGDRVRSLSSTFGSRARSQRRIGWSTNGTTRPVMLGDLREAIESDDFLPPCLDFLRECRTFEHVDAGKYEARSGFHDDCIMAMAVALQVRKSGANAPKVSFA